MSPLLDQALGCSDEERATWLDSVRDHDPALAADVEALLRVHRVVQQDRFLDAPHGLTAPDALAGASIGPYTLLSPIGRGGMGTVWLAERSDGRFERRVAIKFLNRSLAGEEERFRREGRILARLTHRHIAQLLDAGVAADGQPYLVLEHLDGEPIDEYCDRRALDVQSRLRLFLDVLDAVAHAHASLIVHRDLKPSNVLVTSDGCVKLLDFGIAKLLGDEEGAAPAAFTVAGAAALTPAYAAPEQVNGHPVSTATDVYGLGVLLYVLLTGRHPFGEHLRSPADLMNAIVNAEPPRPSAIAGEKLRRILRGDLDTIVGVGLKKQPIERFVSVTAFADDVRRYLRHEPIAARRDSMAYRGAKFARRNRVAVAATAVVAAGVVFGFYAVNRERAIAEQRFMQVRQLANRVLALDPQIGPLPGSTKARHEIVAMAQEYLEALRPNAVTDPDLALEVGIAYSKLAHAQGVPSTQNLGQYAQAEESLAKADALLESVLDRTPRNRTALLESALVAQARMMLADSSRRDDEAVRQARKAAMRLESLVESGPLSDVEADRASGALNNIALGHKNANLLSDAIRYARRSIATVPTGRRGMEISANASSIIADAMRLSGDLEGALVAIREARRLLETLRTSGTVRAATMFNVLWREGVILGEADSVSLGRTAEAVDVLQKAFDEIEQWSSKDAHDASSRLLFASGARELGHLLRDPDPQRALAIYDHALVRLAEVKDNARARRGEVDLLSGSSYVLRRLRREGEAQQRLDTAFAQLKQLKMYPTEQVEFGSETAAALRALADHEAETGAVARALATYRTLLNAITDAAAIAEKSLVNAADLSRLYEAMMSLSRRAGDTDFAQDLAARRLRIWRHWEQKLPGHAFVSGQLAAALD